MLLRRVRLQGLGSDIRRSPHPQTIPIKDYDRLLLHRWGMLLVISDVLGSLTLSGWFANYQVSVGPTLAGAGGLILLWGLVAHSQVMYRRVTLLGPLRKQLWKATISVALTFSLILLLIVGLNLPSGSNQNWLVAWGVGTLIWVWMVRIVWHRFIRVLLDRGHCIDRAVMLGGSGDMKPLIDRIEDQMLGLRVVATAPIPEIPSESAECWVEEAVRMGRVERVFVINFDAALDTTNALLARLARCAVAVTLLPSLNIRAPVLHVEHIGDQTVVDVNVVPLSVSEAVIKRMEDVIIASSALVALVPVFVVVAVAIKMNSPGPVFFRQWRAGFHDHSFKMWKFRTMHHDMRDEHSKRQTSKLDDRVTRVGRFLRRTSIDELPQLFNVLLGDMSIVGPRPHALGMTTADLQLHEVMADYSARHRVKPGITGWAQVCGCRGEVTTVEKLRERVTLDCYYIENWSLAFDLWIMLRTVATLMIHDAY